MDHLFSTEIGERRLHSNPVGTPNLVWIGWKLQKFSLQNFQLIPLSPWVPTFHTQQGGSHVALYRGRYCPKESNSAITKKPAECQHSDLSRALFG